MISYVGCCVTCGRHVGGALGVQFDRATQRCIYCEHHIHGLYEQFRAAFAHVLADGKLRHEEWEWLQRTAQSLNIPWDEGLSYVRDEAMAFIHRALAFAAEDGVVDEREAGNIRAMLTTFKVPEQFAEPIQDRIAFINSLADVRAGKLPSVEPEGVYLDAGEVCYFCEEAVRMRALKRGNRYSEGLLLATSSGIQFVAAKDGISTKWKSIMTTEREGSLVVVGTAKASGSIGFHLEEPEWAEAIFDTAVRVSKRQLLSVREESRHIAQAVKTAVWQRDGGRCVQCGAEEYLEFDHIIPFSKGGASTIQNVQVLCRRCNLKKSARI